MFEITKEKLLHAVCYVPLEEKTAAAEEIAEACCARAEISYRYGADTISMPDMYVENAAMRARFQMGVLLSYLHIPFEPVAGYRYLMAQDDYNRAAKLHPQNRLERWKSDAEVRDNVFDLLRDYKEFLRLIDVEITGRLTVLNDVVTRLSQVLTQTATPSALAELSEMEQGLKQQAASLREVLQNAQNKKQEE